MNNIEADHYTPRSNIDINSEVSSQQISPPYADVSDNQLLLDEANENVHLALVLGVLTCILFFSTGVLALMFAREAGTNFRHRRIEEGRNSRQTSYIASGLSAIIGIAVAVITAIAIALIKGTTI